MQSTIEKGQVFVFNHVKMVIYWCLREKISTPARQQNMNNIFIQKLYVQKKIPLPPY